MPPLTRSPETYLRERYRNERLRQRIRDWYERLRLEQEQQGTSSAPPPEPEPEPEPTAEEVFAMEPPGGWRVDTGDATDWGPHSYPPNPDMTLPEYAEHPHEKGQVMWNPGDPVEFDPDPTGRNPGATHVSAMHFAGLPKRLTREDIDAGESPYRPLSPGDVEVLAGTVGHVVSVGPDWVNVLVPPYKVKLRPEALSKREEKYLQRIFASQGGWIFGFYKPNVPPLKLEHERVWAALGNTVRVARPQKRPRGWCPHCGVCMPRKEIFGEEGRWFHRPCVAKGPFTREQAVKSWRGVQKPCQLEAARAVLAGIQARRLAVEDELELGVTRTAGEVLAQLSEEALRAYEEEWKAGRDPDQVLREVEDFMRRHGPTRELEMIRMHLQRDVDRLSGPTPPTLESSGEGEDMLRLLMGEDAANAWFRQYEQERVELNQEDQKRWERVRRRRAPMPTQETL